VPRIVVKEVLKFCVSLYHFPYTLSDLWTRPTRFGIPQRTTFLKLWLGSAWTDLRPRFTRFDFALANAIQHSTWANLGQLSTTFNPGSFGSTFGLDRYCSTLGSDSAQPSVETDSTRSLARIDSTESSV